jgi:hypothetical protein
MEPGPCWEAASRSATQEFPDILWNLKVDYCVNKPPSQVPILSQMNPLHTPNRIPLKFILILSSDLRLVRIPYL